MKKVTLSVLIAVSLLGGSAIFAKGGKGNEPSKKERKIQKIDDRMEMLKTELGLREEQVPQVKQAILEHRKAIKAIRSENTDKQAAREKVKAENLAFKSKMQSILNEAQYRKFEQMVRDGKKAKKQKRKKSE